MTAFRFVAPLAVVLFAWAHAGAQPPTAPAPHPALADVVKEYKRFGLPFPPANAQLVRINRDRYTDHFGQEPDEERYDLAYRVPPAKPGERTRYFEVGFCGVGFRDWDYVEPAAVEETKPTPDALRSIENGWGGYWLAFAAQCKERGWDDLAGRAYARAREQFAEDEKARPVIAELRDIAWAYWLSQTSERGADLKEALRRLEALAAEDPTSLTERNRWFLRCLKLTVAPRTSKPGSVEALIEDLVDYRHNPLDDLPPEPASYWKLVELGFDAVPALIDHVSDDRLTQAWSEGFNLRSVHTLTVGHLCSRLLFDLSARTIGGDYWEQRGDRIKPDEARKWFEKARKVGEEKWLLDHAVPADNGGGIVNQSGRPEPQIVRVLAAKYPNRLPAVYRAILKKPVAAPWPGEGLWINDYVNEIVVSKLTREQKIALLEEGATSDDDEHRLLALDGLARLDQTTLRKHLLATLKRIQLRAWLWGAGASDVRLVHLLEAADDRACWAAFVDVVKTVGTADRVSVMWQIALEGPPDRKDAHRLDRIRFLVQFLDDEGADIDEDGTRTEVRDFAASQLAGLVGFRVKRRPLTHLPGHDGTRGTIARAMFRAVVWQAARELAKP